MEKDYKKLALLVIPITTFALGTWQIFRLQRKVRLIEDLERKTAIPPMQVPAEWASPLKFDLLLPNSRRMICYFLSYIVHVCVIVLCFWTTAAHFSSTDFRLFPVASVAERAEQLEYRKLTVHGHFDHSREIQMWPRSLLERDPSHANRPGGGSEPGAQVITPFYCQELQSVVGRDRCIGEGLFIGCGCHGYKPG